MDDFEDLKDYEKLYKINRKGEIWSCRHKKILALRKDGQGYISYSLTKNYKSKEINAHRLVAKQFILNPDNLPHVDHIDRNPLNNNVENLRWVSRSENMRNRKDTKHPYIYWHKQEQIYEIRISINKVKVYSSCCKDLDEAILTRDTAMILLELPNTFMSI
jgi:hypothetical protein